MQQDQNILLVAGSREIDKWLKPSQVFHILDNLSYTFDLPFDKVIHGGARGVDTLGDIWARGKGKEVEVFPAKWEEAGPKAGYQRNVRMAHACTHAIVIWDGHSPGTRMMIDLLNSMLIPHAIRVVGYPDNV